MILYSILGLILTILVFVWYRTAAHGLFAWVTIQDAHVEELMFLISLKLARSRLVNSVGYPFTIQILKYVDFYQEHYSRNYISIFMTFSVYEGNCAVLSVYLELSQFKMIFNILAHCEHISSSSL